MSTLIDTSSNEKETNSQTFVRSLSRGLAVLEAMGGRIEGMSSSDIATAAKLDRATARRVLLTLQELKYVRMVDDRYHLSAQVLNFGYGYLSSLPFWELARPIMQQLVETIHESSSAAVLEGDQAVYVARVRSNSRLVDVTRTVGSRIPAYCTSLGRVLLAGLPAEQRKQILANTVLAKHTDGSITSKKQLSAALDQVAEQGWSLVDQELEIGLRSLAVPLHDHQGRVVAALNISVQAPRVDIDTLLQKLLPELQRTAADIDAAARARGE